MLVSGVGRSGTKALRKSLGAHRDFDSTGVENHIIQDVLEIALHNCTEPSRRASMRVDQATYDQCFRRLLLELLWPEHPNDSHRTRILMAYSDLTPPEAQYLLQLFPGTYIVYIVRNGIEVVASRTLYLGFEERTFESHCIAWRGTEQMVRWGQTTDKFILVRHEDLLEPESAEHVYRALFDRIGLSFDPDCVAVLHREFFHPTARMMDDQIGAHGLKGRAERWRGWTKKEVETFTEICGAAMLFLGYPMPWQTEREPVARAVDDAPSSSREGEGDALVRV